MPLHLGLQHVARFRPGVVWTEDGAYARGRLEPLEKRAEPPVVRRSRVLCQEGDMVSTGELHHQVARPAVRELGLRDLVYACRVTARELERAVGRTGVDDEQLDLCVDNLAPHRR